MKALQASLLLLLLGAPWLPRTDASMDSSRAAALRDGERIFLQNWVEPQADDRSGDGLGPLFNAVSCSFCHVQEGRGHPPSEGGADVPRIVRLGVRGPGGGGAFVPEPRYGWQIQEHGVQGRPGEAKVAIGWEASEGRYPDGGLYTLRKPRVDLRNLSYGPLAPGTRMSVRTPPVLRGLGLLEEVPDLAILVLADPEDSNRDGISGRPNYVPVLRTGGKAIGRFGWKANQPTIEQQIATAFQEDMGITWDEVSRSELERVTLFTGQLPVPARRGGQDSAVLRGETLFRQVGCESCHRSRLETASGGAIHPYTDLLLHDMGPDLADGRPDFEADGNEWRTPPLWGSALVEAVSHEIRLLHDGRARSPEEAILWHGGEAAAARDRFKKLPKADRAALLKFLDSL